MTAAADQAGCRHAAAGVAAMIGGDPAAAAPLLRSAIAAARLAPLRRAAGVGCS